MALTSPDRIRRHARGAGHGSQGSAHRMANLPLATLAAFLLAVAAVAIVGSLATSSAVDSRWFEELEKPSWYPPSATFGIVWTPLYVLIAVAGWLTWRHDRPPVAMALWGIQLLLNLAWSVVFFGLRSPGWALVVIVALLASIAATMSAQVRHSRTAALLMAPYLAWVGFATALNAAIVILNS